jgi:2-hydroxy-6-oxonona-2,4-dienedioate hydrolase
MVYDSAFASDELAKQRSAGALAHRDHLKNFLQWPFAHPAGPFGGLEALMTGLRKSRTPTLMIHGRNDRTVPMEATLRTAALTPNARAVILNQCGHWAQLEHQAEFDRLVLGFLEQVPGG